MNADASPSSVRVVDGTEVRIDGDDPRVLLMLHGWPDTLRLWDAQVTTLAPHRRCVRFTLPGFDGSRIRRAPSLVETVALIARVVDAVSPDSPVELLLHDWGCFFGYRYASLHPARVRRIVGVDVGDVGSRAHLRSLRARDKAAIAAYQLWLAAAWRIGGTAGDAMSRRMARLLHAPAAPESITASMNYPYHLQWTGGYREAARTVARFDPPCPMLFVFGRRKPFMFHSPDWADALAATPGSAAVGLETGHWVMRARGGEFDRAVRDWLLSPP